MKKLLLCACVLAAGLALADGLLEWRFEASKTNRPPESVVTWATGYALTTTGTAVPLVSTQAIDELDARPWFARMSLGFFDFEPLGAVLIVK